MTVWPKRDLETENEPLGVAEAKRRFSELIDRVGGGERFVISRHGSPAVMLGPPSAEGLQPPKEPIGLAAVAGALAEWDDIDTAVQEIYAARRRSRDRPAPALD
jgi:antitoxin (DNA-binding transcriptional repressor) of toxin-antitoxin stability system